MSAGPKNRFIGLVSVVLGVGGILATYLTWLSPKVHQRDLDIQNLVPAGGTVEAVETPVTDEVSGLPLPPSPQEPSAPPCDSTETVVLRATAPSRIASGLITLSITPGRLGAEKFLTLGINSDRESRAEPVLGPTGRYLVKTSSRTYFVNVAQADFEANTLTVQVGCTLKGSLP